MNRVWKAEVELLAEMIAQDFLQVDQDSVACICPPDDCQHETVWRVFSSTIHGEWLPLDFLDSETVREADNLASTLRKSYGH